MRAVVAAGVLTAGLALVACGADDETPATDAGPASPEPSEAAAAEAAATAFYDAVAERDCITLRTLSTPEEQREDEAWANCIDVMLEVAGDDPDKRLAYRLGDPEVDQDRVTYTVSSDSLKDGERVARQDPLVLVLVQGTWLVDDSVVTAGS